MQNVKIVSQQVVRSMEFIPESSVGNSKSMGIFFSFSLLWWNFGNKIGTDRLCLVIKLATMGPVVVSQEILFPSVASFTNMD